MRYKLVFSAVYLLLILFVAEVACATCPKPSVKKRTIIQSSESIKNGARLNGKDIVESARECYSLCCNDLTCNVAVMHYKEKKNVLGDTITEKYCFLFSCGSPSVCTYEYHHRYAVIDLGSREDERSSVKEEKTVVVPPSAASPPTTSTTTTTTMTTTMMTTTSPTTIPPTSINNISVSITPSKSESTLNVLSSVKVATSVTKETYDECKGGCPYNYDPVCGDDGKTYDNKCIFKLAKCKKSSLNMAYDEACRECPPGVPMAMCSDDPCKIISCPRNKNAVCKANFCGGCNAVYYDKDGSKVNCSDSGVAVSQIHNEQSVTVTEADYEETPDESLPHAKVSTLPGQQEKDPYYNTERRKWLPKANESGFDANSKIPVVVVVKEASAASSLMSLPLLIALIICIILLIGIIYRVKCVTRGRAKKLPVDDGDYLINGMYL